MDRQDDVNYTDDFLSGEKADVLQTRKEDEGDYQKAKPERDKAKKEFAEEEALPENSKAVGLGQPLRYAIEQILKEKGGIAFAEFHGRAIQGPACRNLLRIGMKFSRKSSYTSLAWLLIAKISRMIM